MRSKPMRESRRLHHVHGLTLVEAAAAVVSLTVLFGALLPATTKVAVGSKGHRCLHRMARIGQANLIYASQDLAEMALPVHGLHYDQDRTDPTFIGAYEWGGKSGRGNPHWVPASEGGMPLLGSKYGTLAGFGPASRPLNPILYPGGFEDHLHPDFDRQGAVEDTQLDLVWYQCPADTGYTGVHFPEFRDERLSSYDHFGTSFAGNVYAYSYAGGGDVFADSPYLHRLSDLLSPATTVAYQENNGRYAWAAAPERPECEWLDPGGPGPVRGWHGKDWTFNAAFVDGHVDTIYMRQYRNPVIFEDPHLQQQFRCTILRGDGWQLDVKPTPAVATGYSWGGGDRVSFEHGIE